MAESGQTQVVRCKRNEVAKALPTAHVAVPLMVRLDRQLLQAAPHLRLILQFGVGVEGIDIPTVSCSHAWPRAL